MAAIQSPPDTMDTTENAAYQESLDYLYRFVDYSLSRNFPYNPESFNLTRMKLLLSRMGDPHLACPVIHIAGTKGKGSTAALIASALRAEGYVTGLYTSPHLEDFRERIQVNGEVIPMHALTGLVNELKPVVEGLPQPATFFEWTTALAFEWFRRSGCEVMVIEVGLGGRLDSTNVIDPLVAVITPVSFDHMAILGDTLAKIAGEKAGIIKPGRPVVTAPQAEEALQVIRAKAEAVQAELVKTDQRVRWEITRKGLSGQDLKITPRTEGLNGRPAKRLRFRLPLLGPHQALNAATAAVALWTARAQGLKISDQAIKRGFHAVFWPGRFEILQRDPLLVIDSAHNPDSALKLRETIESYLQGKAVILLFGASADKDVAGIYQNLLPAVSKVITTQSVHPRAARAGELAEMAAGMGVPATPIMPLEEALGQALSEARELNAAVVAAGSLFIAGAVRSVWKEMRAKSSVSTPARETEKESNRV